MSSRAKIAAVQMNSSANLAQNLSVAGRLLEEAAADGCLLAVLPRVLEVTSDPRDERCRRPDVC